MNQQTPARILITTLLAGLTLLTNAQQVRPVRVNADNARTYRTELLTRIFGTGTIPYNILPDSVISNVSSIDQIAVFPYGSIMYPNGNLDSIDKIVVSVDSNQALFPEKARIYLFHPHQSNGKLFIYHAGHCATTAVAEDILANGGGQAPGVVIPRMIAQGYTVLAVPMIHYRFNPPPGYTCGYNGHNELFTEGYFAFPLGLFFKPLIASLNLLGRSNFSSISLMGLSGGGWVSSVYPAIDSSIGYSVPVAGSWPMAVRNAFFPGGGDFEQTYPPIFSNFLDYHDLYTLSCLAPARKMLQINNRYDPCCFNGSVAHIYYMDSIQQALARTGGEFRFYLDETSNGHVVSNRAMDIAIAYIRDETGSLNRLPPDTMTGGQTYAFNLAEEFNGTTARQTYSLLKAPNWLSMSSTGAISGLIPIEEIIPRRDTISFKAEDDNGRFVVYNHVLTRRRPAPYLFTMNGADSIVYWLPEFSGSIDTLNQASVTAFTSNNPSLTVTNIRLLNRSVVALFLNRPVTSADSIGYAGNGSNRAVRFRNGTEAANFGLTRVHINVVPATYARAGMMRFNTDTQKFEYFNGTQWVDMH